MSHPHLLQCTEAKMPLGPQDLPTLKELRTSGKAMRRPPRSTLSTKLQVSLDMACGNPDVGAVTVTRVFCRGPAAAVQSPA